MGCWQRRWKSRLVSVHSSRNEYSTFEKKEAQDSYPVPGDAMRLFTTHDKDICFESEYLY